MPVTTVKAGLLPKIELTGKTAVQEANNGVDQLKAGASLKQFNLAAIELQKSENKTVAALGRAAEGLAKEKNFDDASLALGMGELLTQTNELEEKYRKEWAPEFEAYVKEFSKKEKFTDADRKQAYLTMSVVYNNIANSSRMEKLDYFEKKAKSPKYKESTKNLVSGAVDGIQNLYAEGKTDQADKALSYLDFYVNTVLKKGIRGKEGRAAVEQSITLGLAGDEKAENMFQKGLQQYGNAIAVRSLWDTYAKMESQYFKVADSLGTNKELEKTLTDAKKYLDAYKADAAVKTLKKFAKGVNGYIEDKMLERLNEIEKDLKATPEVFMGYKKELKNYAKKFPYVVKTLVAKMEKANNKAGELLGNLGKIKTKEASESQKKKFYNDIETFAKEKKDVLGTAATSVLLMNNAISEEQFGMALKISNVEAVRKKAINNDMKDGYGDVTLKYLRASLKTLAKEGADSKKAKKLYEAAVNNKINAMVMLDLERLKDKEGVEKLSFYKDGAMTVYDKCAKAEATEGVWGLNNTLFAVESSIRKSDDKLFATNEAELQQDILRNTKLLASHYEAKIEGKKEGVFSPATVSKYKSVIAKDSTKLAKKIENAEKINNVVKIAASFIHPSAFVAVAVEQATKEYEIAETISWSTGLMLAASALTFRHAAVMKGISVGFEATVASKVITGLEFGLGGVLISHGAYEGFKAFNAGHYAEGGLTVSMLALPLFYAVARKPMITYMGKKMPNYRKFTGELVTETAISKQNKKFGMMDVKKLGIKVWEKAKEMKVKTKAIPGYIKIKIKGAPVPAFAPVPLMIAIPFKIPAIFKKPNPILDALKQITTGDRIKYAKAIGGKEGKNFFDTVQKFRKVMETKLGAVRKETTYKDKSKIYKALQGECKEAEGILKGYLRKGEEWKSTKETKFGFLSIDKAKTWELNNIGKEFGDVGLHIYFKAAENLNNKIAGKKIKIDGFVESIRTTEKGDELLIVFTGKNTKKAMATYEGFFRKEVSSIAEEMGFKGPLKEAITDFGAVPIDTVATFKEGKVSFSAEVKGKTKTMGLESILATAEASEKLIALEKKGINVEPLWKFLELPEIKIPEAAKEIKSIDVLPSGKKLDGVLSFRVKFDPKTEKTMWELANSSGKGVMHVDNGIVGPSVLNQLGHPVTDVFSTKYHLYLTKNLKKAGIKVDTYGHGPMSIGIKGKISTEKLNTVLNETNKALANDKDLAAFGIKIEKVEAFVGKTKDLANYEIAQRVIGHKVPMSSYEKIKNLVTVLHMESGELSGLFKEKKIKPETVKLLKNIKEKEVRWVRNPEDLIHYLGKSMGDAEIVKLFGDLGIKLGKKLKVEKPPVAKPLKKVSFTGPRHAVQKKKFFSKPFDEGKTADIIAKNLISGKFDADMMLATARLAEETPIVVQRVYDRTAKIMNKFIKKDEKLKKKFGKDAGPYIKKILNLPAIKHQEYMPAYELGKVANEINAFNAKERAKTPLEPKARKEHKEIMKLQKKVLEKSGKEGVVGQGVEAQKGGLINLVNIMLEGQITKGNVGDLSAFYHTAFSAGAHGPYYVVVKKGIVKPIPESAHTAYLVPAKKDANLIAKALDTAVEKGLINPAERDTVLKKVITYEEFLKAPEGVFESAEAFKKVMKKSKQ